MKFQGALIKEQGITFGIAIVKPSALRSSERDDLRRTYSQIFGAPTVLMAQDSRGIPEYYGRPDIVNFLSNISISRIPWQEYRLQ